MCHGDADGSKVHYLHSDGPAGDTETQDSSPAILHSYGKDSQGQSKCYYNYSMLTA